MRLIETNCKKCGANLEIDLDHLQAYCQYCGAKLSIDIDDLGKFLSEKEKTKQKRIWFMGQKEKTKRVKIAKKEQSQKNYYDYKIKQQKEDRSDSFSFFINVGGMHSDIIINGICF